MAQPDSAVDLSFVQRIPDEDLEAIVEALRAGAATPADALGFDEAALNTVEQLALALYRGSKHREAAAVFSFVLQMKPQRASAWRGLGACANALKHPAVALLCFDSARRYAPDDAITLFLFGEALCQLGRREEGVAALEDAVSQAGRQPELRPYVLRARAILAARGGIPARVILSAKAHALAEEARAALGEETYAPDPDEPLTVEHIRRDPALKPLLGDLGRLLQRGRTTLAEVGGFTAKELDGAYAVAVKFVEMGQLAQALQLVGFLIMVDPHKGRYYQLAGICLQHLKQYQPAEEYYRAALVFDKDDPRTLVYYGECKILAGAVDEGVGLVRDGLEAAASRREFEDVIKRGESLMKQFGR